MGRVEIVVDKRRVDGTRVLVAEVEVGDDTGSMSVRARDEQIDLLRNISDGGGGGGSVVLRNCNLELYLGKYLRLGVSKWGKLSAYPVSSFCRTGAMVVMFGTLPPPPPERGCD